MCKFPVNDIVLRVQIFVTDGIRSLLHFALYLQVHGRHSCGVLPILRIGKLGPFSRISGFELSTGLKVRMSVIVFHADSHLVAGYKQSVCMDTEAAELLYN